jgi:DNA polymerase (family X)
MTNREVYRLLRQTSTLLELDGENPFKIKAYDKAADAIRNYPGHLLEDVAAGQAIKVEGIGPAIASHLKELAERGSFARLDDLRTRIPEGVVEMSGLRGLGPKKLNILWRDYAITSVDALMEACERDKLSGIKGFGHKTQAALYNAAMYRQQQQGLLHIDEAHERAEELTAWLGTQPNVKRSAATGQVRRCLPVVEVVELLVETGEPASLAEALNASGLEAYYQADRNRIDIAYGKGERALLHFTDADTWVARMVETTGSEEVAQALLPYVKGVQTEDEAFAKAGLPTIPAELREGAEVLEHVKAGIPRLLEVTDLKGTLHAHSTWSDGAETIQKMAEACIERGYEYLGLTDHSQTAAYAGGLNTQRVAEQHTEIDTLNAKLKGFRVLKGIESDILPNGDLDYPTEVLQQFEFIIASIHSGFRMDEAQATQRLIRAVENPYTSIVGHPTGRLLLSREGYPIDHRKLIDACVANGTAIEINANPYRLDIDWKWLDYALGKGVSIAISPDAHSIGGLDHAKWGVAVGRKGWLTPEATLNCLSAEELLAWFKRKRG